MHQGNDSPTVESAPPPGWKSRLISGDRATLARTITAVENESPRARPLLREIYGLIGKARVVGFTGAPGVGKSTLVNAYIRELRRQGQKIGVIAVDPSSPISGGAILGDRIRMSEHGGDEGVFVRSLAARGHLGGLSRSAARVVDVMDAAGKETIIVETVGTGQSEVEISDIAHTKVVVCAPGLGDEIQAVKAGILEIADIVVVNKGDMPLADQTSYQLQDALGLTHREGWQIPVMKTIATSAEGVAELTETIEAHGAQLPADIRQNGSRIRMRRVIATMAANQVRVSIEAMRQARMDELCEAVLKGELDFEAAAEQAIDEVRRLPRPSEDG